MSHIMPGEQASEAIDEDPYTMASLRPAFTGYPAGQDIEERFAVLAEQWRRETGPYSSISRKVSHPAYQKIIAMGDAAIPLILREMRARPAHWFTALRTIARAPPPNEGADIGRATAGWLEWGQERGYLD